jgi:hypothetical protein
VQATGCAVTKQTKCPSGGFENVLHTGQDTRRPGNPDLCSNSNQLVKRRQLFLKRAHDAYLPFSEAENESGWAKPHQSLPVRCLLERKR